MKPGRQQGLKPPARAAAALGRAKKANPPAPHRPGGSPNHRPQQQQQQQQQHAGPGGGALSPTQLLAYERRGCLVTRRLLDPALVQQLQAAVQQHTQAHMLAALQQRIRVLCPGVRPDQAATPAAARRLLARHATQPLGFLQFFNLHRTCPAVAQLVRGSGLAATAAQLMGAARVRLYQDCVFLKEPGYADTNWHSDLRMAPLDTNSFVTAWIPLRDIKGGDADSGLLFAAGSHRDFALPFFYDLEGRDLSDRGYPVEETGPMKRGDVSWHHGWTLHCAGPQPPGTPPRQALTVSFFADGARLLATRTDASLRAHMRHDEDAESYADWLQQLPDGAPAVHDKLPLVHPAPDQLVVQQQQQQRRS